MHYFNACLKSPADLRPASMPTLFFAGEATNTDGHLGTLHGAIATGVRAAQEFIISRKAVKAQR
ncbi:MAG TPA: FAD-dependent oxidoreductase [Acidobacteriota bacterium]|nr:FAD-dependent oxidoreductase [Acidobacteriota bacterium]